MIAERELLMPEHLQDDNADAYIERVIEQYKQHINPGLGRLMQFGGFGDVEISAQGCYVQTASGKQYLDFMCGFGVFALGHRHPRVVKAVHDQLDRMPLSTRTFFSEPQGALAAKLAAITPGDLTYTFYSNSGAEAVEAGLKFARIATGKTDFVSTWGAYHGKTFGALSATGREKYRTPFAPLVPGFTHVDFGDADAIAAAITDRTAGVILEPIQGEGGILVPPAGYLPAVRRVCDERGVLLIADEVQTGFGRTGKMFACEHENVTPDILCLAKALGGGVMPIGATVSTPAVWERLFGQNPLIHSSTFGGNQLACAAGIAAIATIEDESLLANAVARGAELLAGLRTIQQDNPAAIADVRGKGLMIGVEFALQDYAEIVINLMASQGIIAAYTLNNPKVIRMAPPLIVTPEQVQTLLTVFAESVSGAVAMLEGLE